MKRIEFNREGNILKEVFMGFFLMILLTLTLQAESLCQSIDISKIKNIYTKETKDMVVSRGSHYDMKPICKALSKDKILVVIPYRGALEKSELEEGFYALSLAITIIDSKNHEVLYHYFHKDVAESTSIALQSVEVDTRYNKLSNYPLFGIKIMVGQPSSHTVYYDEEQLYLYEFRVKNSPPTMLLSGYVLNYSSGLCDDYDLCKVDYAEVQVDILKSKKKYAPIGLTLTKFSTIRVPSLKEMLRVESKEKIEHKKLIFKEGKYVEKELKPSRELSIAEVKKGAKSGKNYSKFFLAKLLYENYSQEAKTLTQLNDIAYYLQKHKHNKEAVMMLESLLKFYPKRMVAYYNLADAYWALGQKKEAKKMYEVYVKQMKARGKGKRVPKVVKERLR